MLSDQDQMAQARAKQNAFIQLVLPSHHKVLLERTQS